MSKSKGFLSAAAVAAMAFILSCSEDLKPIDRETWEDTLQSSSSSELSSSSAAFSSSSAETDNYPSSSSLEVPSSSSSVPFSSSSEPSSSGAVSSSSSAIPSSSSSAPLCGKTQYDPDAQFCHNNQIVDKCNGNEYNPPEEVCNTGVVGKMCGSTWYNLQTHFCFGGITPTPLCGGEEYTGSQFCRSGKVYDKCGSIGEYDPSKFYCHNGSLSSCGNLPLNPDTQFCSGNTVYDKCGGTVTFAPETEACCGSGKYTIATQFCYNNSKVVEYCGTRTEIFDPDLYECRDVSKIYLKTPVNYDSKSYDAVLIGTQTWMAENLNYKTPDGTSRCYPTSGYTNDSDADNSNCNFYGRLYTWSTAMGLDPSCNNTTCSSQIQPKHKGICPSGWHLPSDVEWDALMMAVGGSNLAGTKLKAASNWSNNDNGTDDYGFSALPGGSYGYSDYIFDGVGIFGGWWSATDASRSGINTPIMYRGSSSESRLFSAKYWLYSVRCVQD